MPERLIGIVRVCQMEMSSAAIVERATTTMMVGRWIGLAKVNDEDGLIRCGTSELDGLGESGVCFGEE
ncbi:unnamed protein product [Linum trigynum]|uniref:Uncharacterized protein n=1 Tax=Linum trigynum TaxID=586398 RepID=A0AAV2FHX4_9ROSI